MLSTKILLDLSIVDCFGKIPPRGNDFLPIGATQDTHIRHDFLTAKRSSKKRWVRYPARRSWMNDFENETSASEPSGGKSRLASVPFDNMADGILMCLNLDLIHA